MRSLTDQIVAELGGRRRILHGQRHHHVSLDRMLDRLPATSGEDRDERSETHASQEDR
jgi:hypothetical protein